MLYFKVREAGEGGITLSYSTRAKDRIFEIITDYVFRIVSVFLVVMLVYSKQVFTCGNTPDPAFARLASNSCNRNTIKRAIASLGRRLLASAPQVISGQPAGSQVVCQCRGASP